MIKIVGTPEVSEYRAAEKLGSLIMVGWPDIHQSERDHITIVVAAKCWGCSVQDIDLVVIGNLSKPRSLPSFRELDGKSILSFVWTIELKGHPADQVVFKAGKVFVPYGRFMKDVTEQAFRQKNSLRDFLKRNIRREPYCTDLIWLDNAPASSLPRIECGNVLAGDSSWEDFLSAAIGNQYEWLRKPGINLAQAFKGNIREQYLATEEICDLFSKPLQATPLDRKRVERITRRVIDDQAYAQKMGEQLLLFRGRGGTGKTMTLIRLAMDLHTNRLSRVLLLTYNVALVADIKRTFAIIGTPQDSDGPVIQVRTVHSFMLELMKQAGVIVSVNEDSLSKYNDNLFNLEELLEAFSQEDLPAFDHVFIDEAQDWPEAERNIVFKIFGAKRVIVADGVDQLVRSKRVADWTARVGNTPKQIVPLRRSLRLKNSLAIFANMLAEELGLPDWSLQANPELSGGRITLLIGPLDSVSEKLQRLVTLFDSDGNLPVDSMICTPFTSNLSATTRQLIDLVHSCGHQVWDGTRAEDRRSFPNDTRQVRLVTYESCRGLEGWNVFCCQLDKLYDQKYREADDPVDLLYSKEEVAELYAASWIMIPMTRAIDHLILHVEDPTHPLAISLIAASRSVGSDTGIELVFGNSDLA
ncbi:DEAD/DEAH box helicase [Novilysobacter avium]|uniref:AAA family ATPase n=1 Tax=Novilysobacter avium TaxID=2781023 RepID=A0A7S6ZWA3_9GAMM|nr:AAA family ATPase [Lysobacter avium]QOW22994.1 AAA family ATPase [Lysobacter avium]